MMQLKKYFDNVEIFEEFYVYLGHGIAFILFLLFILINSVNFFENGCAVEG